MSSFGSQLMQIHTRTQWLLSSTHTYFRKSLIHMNEIVKHYGRSHRRSINLGDSRQTREKWVYFFPFSSLKNQDCLFFTILWQNIRGNLRQSLGWNTGNFQNFPNNKNKSFLTPTIFYCRFGTWNSCSAIKMDIFASNFSSQFHPSFYRIYVCNWMNVFAK